MTQAQDITSRLADCLLVPAEEAQQAQIDQLETRLRLLNEVETWYANCLADAERRHAEAYVTAVYRHSLGIAQADTCAAAERLFQFLHRRSV